MPIKNAEIRERALAAFIGLAVGDALGAPVEFMNPQEIFTQHGRLQEMVGGGWLRLKPGQVTDDTEMSLAVARALVNAGGWSLPGVADNLAAWLKGKPIDVGNTCRKGIRNYIINGSLESPFNEWDAGNGAVMRMLPVALLTLGDDRLLQQQALQQGHLTHNHPLSDDACITMGRLVHLAIMGCSKTLLRREVEGLCTRHEQFRFEPYRGMATGYVVDTMQTVFHYFFRSRNFEEAIVSTVNQGGDADTTAAICGMIAGAYYGLEQIPKRWLKKMDNKLLNELQDLTNRLLTLSPLTTKIFPPQEQLSHED